MIKSLGLLKEILAAAPALLAWPRRTAAPSARPELPPSDAHVAALAAARVTLAKVAAHLRTLRSLKTELAGSRETLFLAPSLFRHLLPAAEEAFEEARRLSLSDPLAAIERHGPEARRMAEEGERLAHLMIAARTFTLSDALDAAAELSEAGESAEWIGTELETLSDRAEELAASLSYQAGAMEIFILERDLKKLERRLCAGRR